MANLENEKPHKIADDEHMAGRAALKGAQYSRAMPMAGPPNAKIPLFTASQTLQLQLLAWQPGNAAQEKQKVDAALSLLTLNRILFLAREEKEIADGENAIPRMGFDPTSASAPSFGQLQQNLAALSEPLPPSLAAAVEKFKEELQRCYTLETQVAPAHPQLHPYPQASTLQEK